MRNLILNTMMSGLMLFVLPSGAAWALAGLDEARLETMREEIKKEISKKEQKAQIQVLAEKLNVASTVVEGLQAQTQDGGEIAIQLIMAEHLSQTNPATYPTTMDSLNKIKALRSEKMGWGKVAKEVGVKLGPVVSAVERTQMELAERVEQRQEPPQQSARPERFERPERMFP
jgi:hypothetical protein